MAQPDMRQYENTEWGFTLEFPSTWQIIWKDEAAGSWMIPIGVAGPDGPGGRPCFSVNARREELLQANANVVVHQRLADGRFIQMPHNPAEYIQLQQAQLVTDLPGYAYTDGARELEVSGCPAASMPAQYQGAKGQILEETITVFAPRRTFQLICEMPVAQQPGCGHVLRQIQDSFRLTAS
jgi:hypothetical protein